MIGDWGNAFLWRAAPSSHSFMDSLSCHLNVQVAKAGTVQAFKEGWALCLVDNALRPGPGQVSGHLPLSRLSKESGT